MRRVALAATDVRAGTEVTPEMPIATGRPGTEEMGHMGAQPVEVVMTATFHFDSNILAMNR